MPTVEQTDPYIQAMFGTNAIHIPINIIVQRVAGGKVTGLFQTSAGLPLLFGSGKTHQLILGDVIVRPRLVAHSDHLRGRGLASIAMSGFTETEEWISGGVLLGPNGWTK